MSKKQKWPEISPEKVDALVDVARDIGLLCPCEHCGGDGGFEDTTYIRTGEWGWCGHCAGKGLIYSGPMSRKAAAAKQSYAELDRR